MHVFRHSPYVFFQNFSPPWRTNNVFDVLCCCQPVAARSAGRVVFRCAAGPAILAASSFALDRLTDSRNDHSRQPKKFYRANVTPPGVFHLVESPNLCLMRFLHISAEDERSQSHSWAMCIPRRFSLCTFCTQARNGDCIVDVSRVTAPRCL